MCMASIFFEVNTTQNGCFSSDSRVSSQKGKLWYIIEEYYFLTNVLYSWNPFGDWNMSRRWQVAKPAYSKQPRVLPLKRQISSQTSRIKSAILHGKAIPIQSYRGLNLIRFEHENDKHGAMVVIAEEVPSFRRMVDISPGIRVSQQAGKYFRVICSYRTSRECVSDDCT